MWGPWAKERWGTGGRKMSKRSGSSQRVSSWLAEPRHGVTVAPAGTVTPESSTSQVAVRAMETRGGSSRSALLDGLGEQRAVGGHRLQLVGVGEEEEEEVAGGAVGGLGPGRQEEPQEGVDRLVVQLLAVDLGGHQVADDVVAGVAASVGHDAGEVVAQAGRGGQTPPDVGGHADQLDRPPLELREVLVGQAQDAGDDPHRELEGELGHEVGVAPLRRTGRSARGRSGR